MKLADIKAPVFKAPGISPSFLLPPESPTPPAPATPSTPEDPASLLGPSPAPTTPTPTP
jgi:hypothetical protein